MKTQQANRLWPVLFALLAGLLFAGCQPTGATNYRVEGSVNWELMTATPASPAITATVTATQTQPSPTSTATQPPPSPTGTATPSPSPTSTATQPAATATQPPPSPTATALPGAVYRVNVPVSSAPEGSAEYNANNRAIFWTGEASGRDTYADVRLQGSPAGLMVRIQRIDTSVSGGDAITLTVNGRVFSQAAGLDVTGGPFEYAYRGNGAGDLRGWTLTGVLPWASLGGVPKPGAVWPMSLEIVDHDTPGDAPAVAVWPPAGAQGLAVFGGPLYAGASSIPAGAQVLSLGAGDMTDAMIGGGTDCGAAHNVGDTFPDWGTLNVQMYGDKPQNMGTVIPFAMVQSQWDIADWPCYSKWYSAWNQAALPPGATVLSATLRMSQFGNPGYSEGETGITRHWVYEVTDPWSEAGISWDNAPQPRENIGYTDVYPLPGDCQPFPYWVCRPGVPYVFDVTEIVKRAQARGSGWASLAMYTAAGQYHSGKHFDSREGPEAPRLDIIYLLPGTPTQPAPSPSPTSTATQPAATATPSPSPSPTATLVPTSTPLPTPTRQPSPSPTSTATQPAATATPSPTQPAGAGLTYYVSLAGNDKADGKSLATAWATFARAWQTLMPGDTLLINDGVYSQQIAPNIRNGAPGKPITIRAINDGAVTIDAKGAFTPVKLGDNWGPNGNIDRYFVVEGLIARNGLLSNFGVKGSNNVLRRVSSYDVSTDENSQAILLWGSDNLVEDCIAAGTGRYMINVFGGGGVEASGNTIRRCYVRWDSWQGKRFCGVLWPNGNNLGLYNSSNGIVENTFAHGRALTGIFMQANHESAAANNNQLLGNVAILSGRDYDGSPWDYRYPGGAFPSRPKPTYNPYGGGSCDDGVLEWGWGGERLGLSIWGQGTILNPVIRDNLSANNMGVGFHIGTAGGPGPQNLTIDRLRAYGNGAGAPWHETHEYGPNIHLGGLAPSQVKIVNSDIDASPWDNSGAPRLTTRYVNGVLTDIPLLPFPMEKRGLDEMGISISDLWRKALDDAGLAK